MQDFFRKTASLRFAITLLAVGIVFTGISTLILTVPQSASIPATAELEGSVGGEWMPYLFLGIGIAAVIAGILLIIKFARKLKAEKNGAVTDPYGNKISSAASMDPYAAADVSLSTEETHQYYFHFYGKMNQSYLLETPERTPVFRAVCDKVGIVKASQYTFENCLTGEQKKCEVSHTITTRYGGSSGNVSVSFPDSSSFKINGVNNWEYLYSLGYTIRVKVEGLKLNFDILKYGTKVATAEAAGANIISDEKQYKLGDVLTGPGLYKVECRESDVEGVFMACFIAGRVEFF